MNPQLHLAQHRNDTIVALATAQGQGAIAVLRVSGKDAFALVNDIFRGRKSLETAASHRLMFGYIVDQNETVVDEVVLGLFRNPQSFTGEDVIEISCHGSPYIIQRIMSLLLAKGARAAEAGEFTQRAFLNGKLDLAQAEAVADLIAADSAQAHRIALNQMRGGFSETIQQLRQAFIDLASLVELELDFSEEDVEFADRSRLESQTQMLLQEVQALADSFKVGNVLKNGVPVAIAGKPNAGKSTLLNALLREDKAIVSDVPGTTRDYIEDEIVLQGTRFRFIDTAGLRATDDTVEKLGIARTYQKIQEARLVVYLFDATQTTAESLRLELAENLPQDLQAPLLLVGNKIDQADETHCRSLTQQIQGEVLLISAVTRQNLAHLEQTLVNSIGLHQLQEGQTIVTNARHYQNLLDTAQALQRVLEGITFQMPTELLASDLRTAIYYLGNITGEITHEDLLSNIFSKFCIGK
ncbi:tRNA uridine-5-carboxymethylaminomethyl(34) synthesis GTPase MnmE [Eisenibacter elegans]|uniref:tRNA uridine-5-carboxymethylaminomethyl(34) synthesis GTPase MnmE n=1 Tax=Eisenibacter elegans TaxID=997 RepID=UPI0004174CA7|nr:tRNA uridine-5-carboxymethylaminomethyl(34) synthesis GTPase MnmE [Eisenibacter elegans]